MPLVHLTVSTVGRLRLTRGPGQLLSLVRAVARADRLLFAVVDDHVHVVDRASRPAHRGRDLRRAMRRACPAVELQPAPIRPVATRAHLERLVGYLLEQPAKHGLAPHPALWPGSCFLDLVGARRLPGFELQPLLEALPRLRIRALFRHVGLRPTRLAPAGPERLRHLGPAQLLEAAATVLALPTPLVGRSEAVVTARALAVHGARLAGLPPGAILPFLGLSSRGARKLALRKLDPRLLHALALRLALEQRVREGS